MTYNFDYISPELRGIIEPATLQSHRFEKKLGYRMYEKVCVAPYCFWDESIGCVIGKNGTVIKDSECFEWKENERFYDDQAVVIENRNVIYLGFLLTVFGHSFTDDLRKMWFLDTDECKRLVANGWELVYTTSWNRPLPDFVVEMFNLAGYDISKARHISEVVKFDSVCIPDNSISACEYGRKWCAEYEMAINHIKSNVLTGNQKYEKIFFSRSKINRESKNKREYGEIKIERVFKRMGYSIIVPEDYSVKEQIQMVRNCKFFAATEGSVAHLSLFCRPGTNVTIVNKANYLNFHQVMINEYAGLNVTYVEAHHSINAHRDFPWWGPFYLCVNRYLERYAGRPILHLPYWLLPSYWEYSRNVLYKGYNRIRKVLRQIFFFICINNLLVI